MKEFTGVYIMGNANKTLYTGMSNNLIRRVLEHKKGKIKGFTQKYNLDMCLYYEFCETISHAYIREKQIKNMSRQEKLNLIQTKNPLFVDRALELFSLVDGTDEIVTYDQI